MKKKPTHGGSREGAGRKPKEPSKVIRVPLSVLDRVMKIVAHARKKVQPVDLVLALPAIVGLLTSML